MYTVMPTPRGHTEYVTIMHWGSQRLKAMTVEQCAHHDVRDLPAPPPACALALRVCMGVQITNTSRRVGSAIRQASCAQCGNKPAHLRALPHVVCSAANFTQNDWTQISRLATS